MNIKISASDINTLKQYSNNDDIHNSSNKKNSTELQIFFFAFDLSIKRIDFWNRSARVITIAYEIRCHPHYVTLLKSTFSDSHINFIPHGLI